MPQTLPSPDTLAAFSTQRDSADRLARTRPLTLSDQGSTAEADITVWIRTARRFQTVQGFGGAITDASAEVFSRLRPEPQEELLRAYFDPKTGLGYSMARTSIHSCDFSSDSYTYVDDGDTRLDSFDIAPDRRHRLPLLHRAVAAAGGTLPVLVSPWSPPGFMKDTGQMVRGGKLLPQYRAAWAQYFVRFIEAYEAEGIPVWGVTVQNEPAAVQTWESHILSAEEERDFLRDHLGPALARAGLADKKILVWDHNRDLAPERAHVIYSDPEAARYAWGLGYHWYETWRGGRAQPENLMEISRCYPNKQLLLTEACVEGFDPTHLGDWSHAERYGGQIIDDLNAGSAGWLDWNILLDERGGPNHVGNFCFAPVHLGPSGDLIYTPSFHYLGHFSKFLRPGAERVSCTTSFSELRATAFVDGDQVAILVMNATDEGIDYQLDVDGRRVGHRAPPHSLQTLVSGM
ncbi:MAG: glycoside hydrolase family 30 beta sandwich domain-containing protein [Myxococcota bacterium]